MDKCSELDKLRAEVKKLKEKLERNNSAFFNIIGKNKDGILIFDYSGKVIYANPSALDLFGKELGELLGENIGVFIDTNTKTEITIVHKTKKSIIVEVNISDIIWYDKPAKLASLRDITQHKKKQKNLEHLSTFDFLTDLPNRVFFEHTLKRALLRAKRAQQQVALLFLDMNGFKQINDQYGHQAGDKLLIHAASVLKSCIRTGDVVSRLGGDEFAIIIEQINLSTNYEAMAKRILKKMNAPFIINGEEIRVSFSIGISIYPINSKTMDKLIKKADEAMYVAKKSGVGHYHFAEPKDEESHPYF